MKSIAPMKRCNINTALSLLILLVAGFVGAEKAAKECITISQGSNLRTQVKKTNVLVSIQDDEEETEDYKELCDRYKSTPVERLDRLAIAKITNKKLADKLLSSAKPHWLDRAKSMIEKVIPSFLKKEKESSQDDTKEDSKFPQYILYKQSNSTKLGAGRLYVGDKTTDAVSDFVSSTLKIKKVGTFMYSLGHLDFIAANFVAATKSDQVWKQKGWAYLAKALCAMQSFQDSTGTFGALGDVYVKTMFEIMKRGLAYPENQIERLEGMLDEDTNKISAVKKEQLQQKVFTLKKFTEPVDVDDKDMRNFVLYAALNGGLLLLLLIFWPLSLLFPGEPESADRAESEDEKDANEVSASKKDE